MPPPEAQRVSTRLRLKTIAVGCNAASVAKAAKVPEQETEPSRGVSPQLRGDVDRSPRCSGQGEGQHCNNRIARRIVR